MLNASGYRRVGRSAFSVFELVVVLAIIGVLAALLFPALQQIRELSRNNACLANLRSIGLAVGQYESSRRNLPPGNLGFSELIVGDFQMTRQWFDDPGFIWYWKRAQHTSVLVLLLPHLEEAKLADNLPPFMTSLNKLYAENFSGAPPHSWAGEWSEVRAAMRTPIEVLHCPSDNLRDGLNPTMTRYVGAQPAWTETGGEPVEGYMVGLPEFADDPVYSSNYFPCSGAYSGGDVPIQGRYKYRGAFACRVPTLRTKILDGASQTILFGESIGSIDKGERNGGSVWVFGGMIRGRGALPWGKIENPHNQDQVLMGDYFDSHVASFGSRHPMHVNVLLADGSTRGIRRDVDLALWYALCGIADGTTIDGDRF
jgi:Protein of unknown function (DUF1559)